MKLFDFSFANFGDHVTWIPGEKFRLHLSSEKAEIIPEILFKVAKRAAETPSRCEQHAAITTYMTKKNHRYYFGRRKEDASRPIFFKQKLPSSKMDREQRALDCLGAAKYPCNLSAKLKSFICTVP